MKKIGTGPLEVWYSPRRLVYPHGQTAFKAANRARIMELIQQQSFLDDPVMNAAVRNSRCAMDFNGVRSRRQGNINFVETTAPPATQVSAPTNLYFAVNAVNYLGETVGIIISKIDDLVNWRFVSLESVPTPSHDLDGCSSYSAEVAQSFGGWDEINPAAKRTDRMDFNYTTSGPTTAVGTPFGVTTGLLDSPRVYQLVDGAWVAQPFADPVTGVDFLHTDGLDVLPATHWEFWSVPTIIDIFGVTSTVSDVTNVGTWSRDSTYSYTVTWTISHYHLGSIAEYERVEERTIEERFPFSGGPALIYNVWVDGFGVPHTYIDTIVGTQTTTYSTKTGVQLAYTDNINRTKTGCHGWVLPNATGINNTTGKYLLGRDADLSATKIYPYLDGADWITSGSLIVEGGADRFMEIHIDSSVYRIHDYDFYSLTNRAWPVMYNIDGKVFITYSLIPQELDQTYLKHEVGVCIKGSGNKQKYFDGIDSTGFPLFQEETSRGTVYADTSRTRVVRKRS